MRRRDLVVMGIMAGRMGQEESGTGGAMSVGKETQGIAHRWMMGMKG
jgi:hypothetical protein